jgi:hypothetical protein
LLCHRLDRNKAHVRPPDGLANRLSVGCIGLVPPHVWLNVLRRDQPDFVADTRQFTRPVVRTGAGFHADNARRQLPKEAEKLAAR